MKNHLSLISSSQRSLLSLLIFAGMLMSPALLAQEDQAISAVAPVNSYVQVTLNDGTLKFGTLLSINEQEVVVDIAGLGATRIPKYLVDAMNVLEVDADNVEAGYAFVSNQATRYFFAPSGIQLDKGEGYFQSNIALNSVSYGFSGKFTGGALVGFLGGGLTAKYGGQVGEKTYISIGGIAAMDFFGELDRPLAIGFVNLTRGDNNKNWSLNLGLGNRFEEGIRAYDWSSYTEGTEISWDGSTNTVYYPAGMLREVWNPMIANFSALLPLSKNLWLITENHYIAPALVRDRNENYTGSGFSSLGQDPYYSSYWDYYSRIPDPTVIVSLGVRSYSRGGWLWDYGLAGVITDGEGFPVPWFSFTREF